MEKGQGTVLYGRGREIEEIEKAVTFDRKFCLWQVEREAREVHRSKERAAIVSALRDSVEPMAPREITDETGLAHANVRQLLVSMYKAGDVEKPKRGYYGLSQNHRSQRSQDHNGDA